MFSFSFKIINFIEGETDLSEENLYLKKRMEVKTFH